jgi:hypothetical protein
MLEQGIPVQVISDNGPAFRSKLLHNLEVRAKIRHLFSTPHHPETNGKVERPHKEFKAALKTYVNPSHTDWDEQFRSIIYALRTTPALCSELTPWELWFSRAPVTPIDLLSGLYDSPTVSPSPHVDALAFQLEGAKIMLALMKAREAKAEADTPARVLPIYHPGQTVLVYRHILYPNLSTKLLPRWAGPFRVHHRVTPLNYNIDLGNGRSQTYHLRDIHAFHPTSHPRTAHRVIIDLFDQSSELLPDPAQVDSPPPPIVPKVGQLTLAIVDEDLRVVEVKHQDLDLDELTVHLYETLNFGSNSGDETRWTQGWYPVYLTANLGQVTRLHKDVTTEIPVDTFIRPRDLYGVPFNKLQAGQKLSLASRQLINEWYNFAEERHLGVV